MRKNLPFFIVILLSFSASSQPAKLQLSSTQFSDNLNKVVSAFKNNYHPIQGEVLIPEGEADVYRSTISLPGSVNTVIYRFHSKVDTTASWQSLMYQGEKYDEAVKAYKNTSRILNKCRLTIPGHSPSGFSGKLNVPDPALTFTSSTFRLDTEDPSYAKFNAEIEILNTGFDSWEVRLNLHNKKDDDEKY